MSARTEQSQIKQAEVKQTETQQAEAKRKQAQYIKIGGQKGYSLLQGLLILTIISIVVTIVLSYFS